MARGLYRDQQGWVMVEYDKHQASIPHDRYVANGYQPPYDELPTQEKYNHAQQKAAFAAFRKGSWAEPSREVILMPRGPELATLKGAEC